jgi:hypothetical protein
METTKTIKEKNEVYMPVKEYAKKFGIPLPTVYYKLKTGALKGKKIGSYQLVRV